MINVFAVFTVKLLQTLQNSSFHKTCYLDAQTTFCTTLHWQPIFKKVKITVPVQNCAKRLFERLNNTFY